MAVSENKLTIPIHINTDSVSPSTKQLKAQMSTFTLTMTVLAFTAPLVVVSGFAPFIIAAGGMAAPVAFIITMLVMLLFSMGFLTMAKYSNQPRNFYLFIREGLGRNVGLGAAFMSISAYFMLLVGTYVLCGVSISSLVISFGGPDLAWWLLALMSWALVSMVGYFQIDVSAKIMCWIMFVELLLVGIFNASIFISGGQDGLSTTPFSVSLFLDSNIAVALLFCILAFIGFEATLLYRDEVKNPEKTIPKATYIAVAVIGLIYIVSTYSLLSAYGSDALAVAEDKPNEMFTDGMTLYVAHSITQIAHLFVVTSVLATLLSIHNAVTRYIYNLSKDHVLPRKFSAIHPKFNSPYIASLTVTSIAIMALLPMFAWVADGTTIYGKINGLGCIGVIVLMALVSLAVLVWFVKEGHKKTKNYFMAVVAPMISFVVFGLTALYIIQNLELVLGGEVGENSHYLYILLISFSIGVVLAKFYKLKNIKFM